MAEDASDTALSIHAKFHVSALGLTPSLLGPWYCQLRVVVNWHVSITAPTMLGTTTSSTVFVPSYFYAAPQHRPSSHLGLGTSLPSDPFSFAPSDYFSLSHLKFVFPAWELLAAKAVAAFSLAARIWLALVKSASLTFSYSALRSASFFIWSAFDVFVKAS